MENEMSKRKQNLSATVNGISPHLPERIQTRYYELLDQRIDQRKAQSNSKQATVEEIVVEEFWAEIARAGYYPDEIVDYVIFNYEPEEGVFTRI
jgi:hypothetical protein